MTVHSYLPRLADIVEAIGRIRHVLGDMPLEAFETDWECQWLVERGVEIVALEQACRAELDAAEGRDA